MCYSVYISTDSLEDLGVHSSERVRFERLETASNDPCTGLLEFSHRWYVASASGCSCSFRHLSSVELGFDGPVDWYPEDEQDVGATRELYTILSNLLLAGFRVDLIDTWYGTAPGDVVTIDVSLNEVSGTAFRLFENHRFRLSKRPRPGPPSIGQRGP